MPKAPTWSCRGFGKRGIYHKPFNIPGYIGHHINLKAAEARGLTIAETLLPTADKVIQ
jgi:hypothetical protein